MARRPLFSKDEIAWIKAMSDMPRADLHALFVTVWNRPDVFVDQIKSLCSRKGWKARVSGCFPKGNVPPNKGKKGMYAPGSEKGWFKKGHARSGRAIELYKPIGSERVTRDGYLSRKVNDDLPLQRRWELVHRINWQAENGPIPAGHRLKCLDGNRLNVAAGNWAPVPMALGPRLAGRFGRDYDGAPAELKPLILATARLEHAARETRRGRAQ